jgi:hypothetical protein
MTDANQIPRGIVIFLHGSKCFDTAGYSAASSKVSKLIVQSKFLLENFKFW